MKKCIVGKSLENENIRDFIYHHKCLSVDEIKAIHDAPKWSLEDFEKPSPGAKLNLEHPLCKGLTAFFLLNGNFDDEVQKNETIIFQNASGNAHG